MPTTWQNTKTLQVDGDTGLTASQPAAEKVKLGIDISAGDKQVLFWGTAGTQFQGSANLTFDSAAQRLALTGSEWITSPTISTLPFKIQLANGALTDAINVVDNLGGPLAVVSAAGSVLGKYVHATLVSGDFGTNALAARATADGDVAEVIRGHSLTQSANLTEWQTSAGGLLASVTKDGYLRLPSGAGNTTAISIGGDTNYILDIKPASGQAQMRIQTYPGAGNDLIIGNGPSSLGGMILAHNHNSGAMLPLDIQASLVRVSDGSTDTADVKFIVRDRASQAGNLQEWQDSGSNALTYVTKDGDLVFANGVHGLPYGSCWGNDIAWTQASAVQNTWYPVSDTDMTDGQLNLVTHDGSGQLTVSKAGRYLVNYGICLESSVVNEHIETGISVSGTVANDGRNHFHVFTPNAEIPIGCTAILNLAASATVQIAVRTPDAGTPNLTVEHANLSIVQVGG